VLNLDSEQELRSRHSQKMNCIFHEKQGSFIVVLHGRPAWSNTNFMDWSD